MPSQPKQNVKFFYGIMMITGIAALTCAYFGGNELYIRAKSGGVPEEISLRDLIKRGKEGNPYIILKDFAVFDDYIIEKKRLTGRWTKVWIPIVPLPADPRDVAIHAFIYCDDVGSAEEVRQRFGKPQLRGMINPIRPTPGFRATVAIEKAYPKTEAAKCLIIDEGKEPAGIFLLSLYFLGFVVLFASTVAVGIVALRLRNSPVGNGDKSD